MFTKAGRKDSIFGFVSGTTGLYLPTVWILVDTMTFILHCYKSDKSYIRPVAHTPCFTHQSRPFFHSLHQNGMQKICILKAVIQMKC